MASGYKLNYLMVCDEARQEVSGKDILIGVYNDVIFTRQIPSPLPIICFRISVRLERVDFKTVYFAIKKPDGTDLISNSRPLLGQNIDYQTIINMQFIGPTFPMQGRYSIWFGLDEPAKEIGSIVLRLAGETGAIRPA
jgi:hypothetical protein